MMKHILMFFFALIFSFSYASVEILFPGVYLQKDLQGKNLQNNNWFGLFEEENNIFQIKKVNVNFKLSASDDEEDFFTEEKVYYLEVNPPNPLIILSNIENLQLGKLTSCPLMIKDVSIAKKMDLKLFEKSYTLAILGQAFYDQEGQIKYIQNFQININSENDNQILFKSNKFSRSFVSVIFAGDLNSDKSIDLLLDISESYDEGKYILFLSKKENEKFILQKVAEHKIKYQDFQAWENK